MLSLLGLTVLYRSLTGDYTMPAIITATAGSLNREGVARGKVPDLSSPTHVHLAVLTPGVPGDVGAMPPPYVLSAIDPTKPLGERQVPPGAPSEPHHVVVASPFGGTYQEWDRALDPGVAELVNTMGPDADLDAIASLVALEELPYAAQEPGTWAPLRAFG